MYIYIYIYGHVGHRSCYCYIHTNRSGHARRPPHLVGLGLGFRLHVLRHVLQGDGQGLEGPGEGGQAVPGDEELSPAGNGKVMTSRVVAVVLGQRNL